MIAVLFFVFRCSAFTIKYTSQGRGLNAGGQTLMGLEIIGCYCVDMRPENVKMTIRRFLILFSQLENRTILRIVLHGLGSPLWGEEQHFGNEISPTLTRFLFQLRATLRSALAVCFVTVPTQLFQVTENKKTTTTTTTTTTSKLCVKMMSAE